ncbi:alkaline phosphatase [Larsenimonas salina]|uniref:alkaline phosphatase n=1 Tax=Larsenimonas salina TaxID=1295565 RepID=UPI00207339C1|nr:alkaline phosphatase [Larsenimonas salina]MCM5704549.1 alkaline phosphatase [Larsenimonas salina]
MFGYTKASQDVGFDMTSLPDMGPFQGMAPFQTTTTFQSASSFTMAPQPFDASPMIDDAHQLMTQALDQAMAQLDDALQGFMPGMAELPATPDTPDSPADEAPTAGDEGLAQNVILMVPDGFGPAYAESFRAFKGGEEVPAWESADMLTGAISTESANSPVTDSAAAGTAFATGQKTDNGMISKAPDGTDLTTLVDIAEAAGKATGVVSTSTVTHATPAVFGANVADRNDQHLIAEQFIDNDQLDVILGGGARYFTAEDDGGDGVRDLLTQAEDQGYELLTDADDLDGASGDRLLGLFAEDALDTSYGESGSNQPTLAEMTDTALETLSKDDDGFFLMVEGSQIDWAGHANDAGWAMNDSAAFEDAVKEAQAFSEANPDTLIVIAPDHETGGMVNTPTDERDASIYQNFTGTYEQMLDTANARIEDAGEARAEDILQSTVSEMTGDSVTLSDEEMAGIMGAESEDAALEALTTTLNERGGVSYNSGNHTAVDVPLYADGPGAGRFEGLLDNTEVSHALADAMGLSLSGAAEAEAATPQSQPMPDVSSMAELAGLDLFDTSASLAIA